MEIAYFEPSDLIPYETNPRRNDGAVEAVAASIREFGFRQPIVVDETNTVLVGHTRLSAALSLELERVPVHVAEGLTDAQKRAYRIADNRLSERATWDQSFLALELEQLQELDFDLDLTGFEAKDIEDIMEAAGGFVPSLDPTQGGSDVTRDDINRAGGKLASQYEGRGHELLDVTCPHCGEEFGVRKSDVLAPPAA